MTSASASSLAAGVATAARNNALWCATMCRAHGVPGVFGERVWSAARPTPPLYPDAVTLAPDASAAEVLDALGDRAPGASVKDSFGALDLSDAGFSVLFEANWLYRPAGAPAPAAPPRTHWSAVTTEAGLTEWAHAWAGPDGPATLWRPSLLADPSTTVLAAHPEPGAGRPVAGAVVTAAGGAAGVSNLFATDDDLDAAWAGCLAAVTTRHPTLPIVGYESGPPLTAATGHGCAALGPLRVWVPTAP
ncbi:hypothetical protein [Streptomyces sp. NPDC005805]|uniref:hypothetical protein n=1 Tax=Streptomyces sp. NPDC005805 TaxID=3157068 RepID=UPI003411C879